MKKIICYVLILLGLSIVYFIVYFNFTSSTSESISSSVIFITLLVLFWYTFETRNIHLITKKQLEISNKPILAVELEDKGKLMILIIHNVGNGPAFNIDIPDVIFNADFEIKLQFESINFIRPGDKKTVEIMNFSGGRESDFPFHANLKREYANSEVILQVKYNDIEMKDIEQKFELGTGRLKIYVV